MAGWGDRGDTDAVRALDPAPHRGWPWFRPGQLPCRALPRSCNDRNQLNIQIAYPRWDVN